MTLLFLPGFMADRTLWDDVADHLDTPRPLVFGDLNTGDSLHDMAQAVLDTAPASFVLVGFSMGGYVARHMARLAPDRVRALILVATSARPDSPEQARRKENAVRQIFATGFSGLSQAAIQAALHTDRTQDRTLIERVQRMSVSLGQDVFARQASIRRDGDLDELQSIACPTLIVAAEGDRLRSLEESRELLVRLPHAELAVIPHSGHMIPLEAPRELARVMSDWMKTNV